MLLPVRNRTHMIHNSAVNVELNLFDTSNELITLKLTEKIFCNSVNADPPPRNTSMMTSVEVHEEVNFFLYLC